MKIATTLLLTLFLITTTQAKTVSPKEKEDDDKGFLGDPIGQPFYIVDSLLDEVSKLTVVTAPLNPQSYTKKHKTILETYYRFPSREIEGIGMLFSTKKRAVSLFDNIQCENMVAVYDINGEKVIERESEVRFFTSWYEKKFDMYLNIVFFQPTDYTKLIKSDNARIRFTLPGSGETVTLTIRSLSSALKVVEAWRDANWTLEPFEVGDNE